MPYVATINVPGYLPMDDDPPVFDTAAEAWAYLAEVRHQAEDDLEPDTPRYSGAAHTLSALGHASSWHQGNLDSDWQGEFGLGQDGTGTIYGNTPGYEGDHDLGLAYSVSEAWPEGEEKRYRDYLDYHDGLLDKD